MPTALFSLRLGAASLLMLMTAACASPPAPADSSPADTGNLWQKIQAASANASCDNDSQCHTIGAGAKACGGPERYLPWSSRQGDGAELRRLVDRHAAARRAEDAREAVMSTCSMVADPGASCRAGRCTLNPANAPGSPPNLR